MPGENHEVTTEQHVTILTVMRAAGMPLGSPAA
jgi:hypothetical protein